MRRLLHCVGLFVLLGACGGGGGGDATAPTPTPPAPTAVASVRVTLSSVSVIAGQTASATAEALSATGAVLAGRTIAWSSSNPSVATVTNGQITTVAPGTTDIVATSEGQSGRATLTVTAVPVASVTLSSDSLDVPLRATTTLVATVRDAAGRPLAGRTVAWSTSSVTTASVSDAGVVRMLLPGTVTITATVEGRSATTRVRGTVVNLNAMADSMRLARNLPAVGLVIVSREGIIGIGAAGVRTIGGNPVDINDRWHLGSNTKALTAFLAGMAVEANVLEWTRTMATAFPDLAATMRPEYRAVTLRELLNHSSGFVNTTTGLPPATVTDLPLARTQWIAASTQVAPQNPIGTYFYSNNGYAAAGAMIERAWGQSYEALMDARIFRPLGVSSLVGWGPADQAGTVGVTGHLWNGTSWDVCVRCDNRPGLSSAGTMNATLGGWARIIQEILLADQGRSALLTRSTARTLTSPVAAVGSPGYGLGWVVGGTDTNRRVFHDGSNTRNTSRAVVFLDAGVAYLITTNGAALNDGASATGIVGTAFGTFVQRLDGYWVNGR